MNAIHQMSTRIYSGCLSLYPSELRREFGEEMTQVFAEDLEDSYRNRGVAGAIRVYWRSVKELLRIALPVHISKREIAVPLLVFLLSETDFNATLLTARAQTSGPLVTFGAGMLFSLVPALIALLAIRVSNHDVPAALELGLK